MKKVSRFRSVEFFGVIAFFSVKIDEKRDCEKVSQSLFVWFPYITSPVMSSR